MKGKILDYDIFKDSAEYVNRAGLSTWGKFFSNFLIMPKSAGTFRTYDSLRSPSLCHALFHCSLSADPDLIKVMSELAIPEKAIINVHNLVFRHFLKELKIFAMKMKIPGAHEIAPLAMNLKKAVAVGQAFLEHMHPLLREMFDSKTHLCWLTATMGISQSKRKPENIHFYSGLSADMSKSFGHDIPGIEFGGVSFNSFVASLDYPLKNDFGMIKKAVNRIALDTFPKAVWK